MTTKYIQGWIKGWEIGEKSSISSIIMFLDDTIVTLKFPVDVECDGGSNDVTHRAITH